MKKKIIVVVMVIAMVFSVVGCEGKMTLESLLEVSAKNAKKVKSFEMGATMELDVDVDMDNMSVGITADGEVALEYTKEASHITGEIAYSAATEEESVDIEAYLIKDDDEYEVYQDNGQGWEMTSSEDDEDMDVKDIDKVFEAVQMGELIGLLADYEDDLELNKELEKVNKKDAYLIEGEVDGNYLIDLLESIDVDEATDSFDELIEGSDMELGDIKVDISIWIDKSSKLPVKMTVDFKGAVETVVDAYMKMMTTGLGGVTGEETTSYLDGMKIKTNTALIEMTFSSFDKVKKIEVPDDVIDEAEEDKEVNQASISSWNDEISDAMSEIDDV
jgi:hypothetical protein